MIKKTLSEITTGTADFIKENKDGAIKFSIYMTIFACILIAVCFIWQEFGRLGIFVTMFPVVCFCAAMAFGSSDGRS